jgi:hypothetical protein
MVRDSVTHQPVPGVKVILVGGRSLNDETRSAGMTASTNEAGTFSFLLKAPGPYWITVESEDYLPGPEVPRFFGVSARDAKLEFDLDVVRPSSISGRIVDAESKKPVPGISVVAYAVSYALGRRTFQVRGQSATTGSGGTFHIERLPPSGYFLESTSPSGLEAVVEASVPPSTNKAYARQWWPSDPNDSAQPFVLSPGAAIDLGDLPVVQEPVFRLTGVVRSSECAGTYQLGLQQTYGRGFFTRATTEAACGTPFVIANLKAGDYAIVGESIGVAAKKTVNQEIRVAGKSLEVDLPAYGALDVDGTVNLPEGFPAGMLAIRTKAPPGASGGGTWPVRADRKFLASLPPFGAVQLSVVGLPPGSPYYVRGILYNGASLQDRPLEINPYAVIQTLTVNIAADGGAVRGQVRAARDPAAGASVFLLQWPLRFADDFPVYAETTASANGEFVFTGVRPGDYRVLSVPASGWKTGVLHLPGVLASTASDGTLVSVEAKTDRRVRIELSALPTR